MTRHRALLAALPLALNFEAANPVPDWVQLTPPGPRIAGRDGRAWTLDAEAVALAFRATLAEPGGVPLDIEHATEVRAPRGEPAPAVGWLAEVEARGGALWARVDWTDEGRTALASRAYRYLSPAFLFDPKDGRVLRLTSVGLTNRPNFRLPALNTETPMDPEVLAALGLAPDATPAQAVTAINALRTAEQTALNRAATPDPALFVPRADHQLALNRLTALETAAAAAREAEIGTAVDAAVAAGKIAPASRDYHLASCRAEGGLERFRALIAATPAFGDPAPKPATPPDGQIALNAEQARVAKLLGIDPKAYAATLAAESQETRQ